MRSICLTQDYDRYTAAWQRVAEAGVRHLALDTWAAGRRYLSLTALVLSAAEAAQLKRLSVQFGRLLDRATLAILQDPDWWPALDWPWPAIELARQEPVHPHGRATLFGRFDCLLDSSGTWQIIEYNADTPSGGREVAGLQPAIARAHSARRSGLTTVGHGIARRLSRALTRRIAQHHRPVRLVGVVSCHSWLEDMAEASWLGLLLNAAGQPTLVGDVTDLVVRRGALTLRGRRIDAVYRFYPVERLYRHAVFAPLMEAAIDGRVLLLNGLRGFVAQSKATLAWLWANRRTLGSHACADIERHLPPTLLARRPAATRLLADGVVKHVNGREGDSVAFGATLSPDAWEARLLEGGYVVQRLVRSPAVGDVSVDDWAPTIEWVVPRIACVGAFCIDGQFGGCYTRLDGPITTERAAFVATLAERAAQQRSPAVAGA